MNPLRRAPCAKIEPSTRFVPEALPRWFLLCFLAALTSNLLATASTYATIEAMREMTPFATTVRRHDLEDILHFNLVAYPITTALVFAYLAPLLRFFRAGGGDVVPPVVRRRAVNGPLFLAAMGFAPWAVSCLFFPLVTIWRFGYWSTELMSQHILSPLVNGFLAATSSYLLYDWITRIYVVPRVFPEGRLSEVTAPFTLNVRGRLIVFLIAVAFLPLFTMFGLVRAAATHIEAGLHATAVIQKLNHASEVTFFLFVLLGMVLASVLWRTLTQPIAETATALREIQAGNLEVNVAVESSDEVGLLQDGVNAMVATLRERERILQTFGRVVEPAVRDHLLSGNLQASGEVRLATIMFCDLRGFTSLAERSHPGEMLAGLNEFFTLMTVWVRECGGFVNKFLGDAIMVVFGLFESDDLESQAAAAAAAVRCGRGMPERLAELNRRRAERGLPPLSVSIGIHSGEVVAGAIGALDRHEYSVIGDTVNVAARLQELCKEGDGFMLVSRQTSELAVRAGLATETEPHQPVALRGRREPVEVLALR